MVFPVRGTVRRERTVPHCFGLGNVVYNYATGRSFLDSLNERWSYSVVPINFQPQVGCPPSNKHVIRLLHHRTTTQMSRGAPSLACWRNAPTSSFSFWCSAHSFSWSFRTCISSRATVSRHDGKLSTSTGASAGTCDLRPSVPISLICGCTPELMPGWLVTCTSGNGKEKGRGS